MMREYYKAMNQPTALIRPGVVLVCGPKSNYGPLTSHYFVVSYNQKGHVNVLDCNNNVWYLTKEEAEEMWVLQDDLQYQDGWSFAEQRKVEVLFDSNARYISEICAGRMDFRFYP